MSRVWPVNTLFQKVGKSCFVQTQLEAFQEHPSSLAINLNISFVFPLYLKYLEKTKSISNRASSKESDCVTAILLKTNMPKFSQNNASSINQLEHDVHVVNVGKARTMDW